MPAHRLEKFEVAEFLLQQLPVSADFSTERNTGHLVLFNDVQNRLWIHMQTCSQCLNSMSSLHRQHHANAQTSLECAVSMNRLSAAGCFHGRELESGSMGTPASLLFMICRSCCRPRHAGSAISCKRGGTWTARYEMTQWAALASSHIISICQWCLQGSPFARIATAGQWGACHHWPVFHLLSQYHRPPAPVMQDLNVCDASILQRVQGDQLGDYHPAGRGCPPQEGFFYNTLQTPCPLE